MSAPSEYMTINLIWKQLFPRFSLPVYFQFGSMQKTKFVQTATQVYQPA